ncbi:MAG: hypothetical protein RBS80_16715 [Thermoguttaceae bacterium]|jgi:hypothetical protein|nr:hypothetical protein [Thermoguttaceae bacterium]
MRGKPTGGPSDGAWHEITLDVRKARESYETLKHLARFQFFTNWREDAGQEFWFDDFVISGE